MSDINIGQITEALNDKADRDMMNVDTLSGADAVVEYQEPTSANNYIWYRKYKSGWVEQGGVVSGGTSQTITLPVVMADEYYSILLGNRSGTYEQIRVASQTATTLVLKNSNNSGTVSAYWQVSGLAA